MSILIICNPGELYRHMSEEEASGAYTKMAITEFDKLVDFSREYQPWMETEDLEMRVGRKGGRDLRLKLFYSQQMTRVGDVHRGFRSSSYLFNPSGEEGLMLPDLDVVSIEHEHDLIAISAAREISSFYARCGWMARRTTLAVDEIRVRSTSERGPGNIVILNPQTLLQLARDLIGYNPRELAFREDQQ